MRIEGLLGCSNTNGSSIILLDERPIAKEFLEYLDKNVKLVVTIVTDLKPKRFLFKGHLEVFYFEGKDYYGGTKFANDLNVGERDVLALLEKFIGSSVSLEIIEIQENI